MNKKLTPQEECDLKKAFKSTSQGITNNETFNDSTHTDGNLQQTGTSQLFTEEKKEKKKC